MICKTICKIVLSNSPYAYSSSSGLYLYDDCPEMHRQMIDFTKPFYLEMLYYSTHTEEDDDKQGYYIFSRQKNTASSLDEIFTLSVNTNGDF